MTTGTGATRHVAAGGAQRAQRLRWWVAALNQSTVAAASVATQWTAVGGGLASALDWLVIARSTACCQIGQLLCGKDTLRLRIVGEQCMVFQALSCLIALAAMTFVSLTHSVEMVRGKWEMSFEYVQFQLARLCALSTNLPSFLCPFFEWYLMPFTFLYRFLQPGTGHAKGFSFPGVPLLPPPECL